MKGKNVYKVIWATLNDLESKINEVATNGGDWEVCYMFPNPGNSHGLIICVLVHRNVMLGD